MMNNLEKRAGADNASWFTKRLHREAKDVQHMGKFAAEAVRFAPYAIAGYKSRARRKEDELDTLNTDEAQDY